MTDELTGMPIPPRRKDMEGLPQQVDKETTMCLLNNLLKKPKQQQGSSNSSSSSSSSSSSTNSIGNWHLIDIDFKKEPKARATFQSILAGSIRPNARLSHSHLLSAACRCGHQREDVQHVFKTCQDHVAIRDKYDRAISQEISRDVETRHQLQKLTNSPTFDTCGIMPAMPELVAWQDLKQEDEDDAAEIPELTSIEAH